MTDKENIRAEIERLLNKEWKWGSSTEAKFRCETYRELLEFIDSLPKEPAIKDLEEAAEEYSDKVYEKNKDRKNPDWNSYSYGYEDAISRHVSDAFIDGANWQKEQMMKDAVEGEITDDVLCKHLCYDAGKFLEAWDKFNIGDKVKIIVIKEADK